MSKQLSQVVANRMNMQPVLISPAHGSMVIDGLRLLASMDAEREQADSDKARETLLSAYGYYGPSSNDKPFVYADGVAFIPITGMLINRFNSCYGWVTGYNYIRAMLNAAVEDDDVKVIVLDCNSGGGEVAGCFELAADIRVAREKKPLLAVIDSDCYSACYALASAATRVVSTPSGGSGSIGVVAMHIDFSKLLTDAGINVTFIFSGDHKVDGNPYEPLPAPVRKSIQARVDVVREEFVALVATNRGLEAKVVFDTQAECYTASEAMALGLIDAIAPPLEAVQAFLIELSRSDDDEPENEMTTAASAKPGAGSATPAAKTEITAPAAETTVVTTPAAEPAAATATVDATAERKAERDRIAAITGHEAAKDKPALANYLALNTECSVDEAAKILTAAAPETKPAALPEKSAFAAAMENSEHPNVGADTGADGKEMTMAQKILRSQALATGAVH